MNPNPANWASRVLTAVVLLLVIAGAARAIWELMRPLLGALVMLAVVAAVLSFLIRRHRRW